LTFIENSILFWYIIYIEHGAFGGLPVNNNYMTAKFSKKFLDEIKAKLKEEKEKLERGLGKFAHKNPKVKGDYDTNFPDYGDDDCENVAEVAQYDTNLKVEETYEKKLRDIKKTLKRLEKGDYGICTYCKNPMEEKRLRARPTSGACVSCKKTLTQEA